MRALRFESVSDHEWISCLSASEVFSIERMIWGWKLGDESERRLVWYTNDSNCFAVLFFDNQGIHGTM